MPVHRIRLIGPWEFRWGELAGTPISADGSRVCPFETSGSVKMPCDWNSLFGLAGGQASFSRRFHRPTNLESHEQVVIVLTGVGGSGTVMLNGQLLSEFSESSVSVEVNVTDRLQAFNVLEIGIHFHPSAEVARRGGMYDAVVLEIRS